MTALGDRLKALAASKNVSAEDLGKAAGIDGGTVSQIFRGEIARPPDERLRGFAKALGVSFEDLLNLIPRDLREAESPFVEAGEAPRKFRIRAIRAGLSGNGVFYPDKTLREAVPLFNGARVFVKGDVEHNAGRGKDFRNLLGRLVNAAFVEGAAPDTGEILADFEIFEAAGDVAAKLREAHERGMANIFGFSIDAVGAVRKAMRGGRQVRVAAKFREVKSVDLIVEPGAGGQLIELIESLEDPDMKLRERMLKLIEAKLPDAYAKLDPETADAEAVEALYREAVAAEAANGDGGDKKAAKDGDDDDGDAPLTREEAAAMVRMAEARGYARSTVAASKLPDLAKQRLSARFAGEERFAEADVDKAIKEEGEYLARFSESGHVMDLGDGSRFEAGEGRPEKVAKMLDAFFNPADRSTVSFKECYVDITGDKRITGRARDCDEARLRESLASTDFANVLGDSITRRMIADYRIETNLDIWRRVSTVVPVGDFRTQERTRFGGYGDLPTVAQGAPYTALASPTDEKATYAVVKRGGTEDVTLEMIKNDDVGSIQRIPVKLSRAAKRTLSKFVLDFIRLNPVIYDGLALFHATHGNLGTAALSATSLAAGRLSMKQQVELNSGEQIGVGPRDILVSDTLEEAAVDLFRRNTQNDKTFIQSLSLNVVPVWYWTDANDWALAADPNDVPAIEVGFLDGNEEPELFVQDNPSVGSMFSNDKLTWKIRHPYGGTVEDFRGLYKAVVA